MRGALHSDEGDPARGGDAPAEDGFAARLGARLLELGLLDHIALSRAERAARQSGRRLDLILAELGLVPEDRLAEAMARLLGLEPATSDELARAPAGHGIDVDFLRARAIVPLALAADRVVVAVADPFDRAPVDALAFLLERPVECRMAARHDILRALERRHGAAAGASGDAGAAGSRPAPAIDAASAVADEDVRRLEDIASDAPTIRAVQDLIVRAVEGRASDIHFEPRADSLRVRFRIDGVLQTVERLPHDAASPLTTRIKVLARLDIAERRLPQDGRIKAVVRGREIDMRVSTVPTMTGESVVLRILDRAAVHLDFAALGFASPLASAIERLVRQPNGIVLVTGPTGSGKTTTLYTALGSLDAERMKIFTVEDPVEYQLPGINQMQVHARIGLGFPAALRSILRQDPNVILIGEIRDLETAQIAVQASLTGHLVLSTVHTNSAAATVTRLVDMGIESWLLASSLAGVLAQRLVRRVCEQCARPVAPTPELVARLAAGAGAAVARALGRGDFRLRSGSGCAHCSGSGYDGRVAICELLVVDDSVRDLVLARGSDRAIEAAAVRSGMATMYDDGIGKVLAGVTTLDEVLRVTRLE